MPAMLDDPTAPVIYRRSGDEPHHAPFMPLPIDIIPRQVMLRDKVTVATLIPFNSPSQVPLSLISYLCDLLNKEIEKGDTYPMIDPMPVENFGVYWFSNFGAVMVMGDISDAEEVRQMGHNGVNWAKECLGSFYIKPNYPGRSSHVCNGGFLVTDAARNRGVGRLMGEGYLEWAPTLGYTYSVFNLVYETNVASCRIWDALGFKRIGRVKGCGNLRSYPDQLVDAIIYGRDLGPEGEDYVSEERFEKIKFYLKNGKYPNGADRAEKSRLRSAATHYKLLPATDTEPERLMLKDKEVVLDPQQQYELARRLHLQHHGGINKTTASIAEKYHWVRIKDTVSQVIKNCPDCRDTNKQPPLKPERSIATHSNPSSVLQDPKITVPVHIDFSQPTTLDGSVEQQNPTVEQTAFDNLGYKVPVDPRLDNHKTNPSVLHNMFQTPIGSGMIPFESSDAGFHMMPDGTAFLQHDQTQQVQYDDNGEFAQDLRSAPFNLDG